MKRLVSASLGLLAVVAVAPASAADLPRGVYRPAMVMSGYNWTGVYIGVHGGYAWGTSGGLDLKGGFVGGQIGYNWQAAGSPWVFGIEFDSAWADLGNSETFATGLGTLTASSNAHYLGSLRPRVGYAWDRTMLYATGGLAWVTNTIDVSATLGGFIAGASDTQTHLGGTIGFGVEHAFTPNLSGKLEYLYTSYGSKTYFPSISGGVGADGDTHALRVGLNYNFR